MRNALFVLFAALTVGTFLYVWRTETTPPPAEPPPPAGAGIVPTELEGRYLVKLGNPADLDDPLARWCYIDIYATPNRDTVQVDPWRPDEQEVTSPGASMQHGAVRIVLERSYQQHNGEVDVDETWVLTGGWERPKLEPAKAKAGDEEEDAEEYEEDAEEEADPLPDVLRGRAQVTVAWAGEFEGENHHTLPWAAVRVDGEADFEDEVAAFQTRKAAQDRAAWEAARKAKAEGKTPPKKKKKRKKGLEREAAARAYEMTKPAPPELKKNFEKKGKEKK